MTLTGYQVIKFNIDDKAYESASVSYNSLPIMRYAEVLLNYAEAKAELGEFSDDIWNKTINRCVSAQASTASARRRQTPICNSTTG